MFPIRDPKGTKGRSKERKGRPKGNQRSQKGAKGRPKGGQRSPRGVPKETLDGLESQCCPMWFSTPILRSSTGIFGGPFWSQNHEQSVPKMDPKSDPQKMSKGSAKGSKRERKWSQKGSKSRLKNNPKARPKRDLFLTPKMSFFERQNLRHIWNCHQF